MKCALLSVMDVSQILIYCSRVNMNKNLKINVLTNIYEVEEDKYPLYISTSHVCFSKKYIKKILKKHKNLNAGIKINANKITAFNILIKSCPIGYTGRK